MINAKNFGLSVGILWGLIMLVMSLISMATGYAGAFLTMMADIYPGYSVSWGGAFIGLVYGFIDGFIGGFLLIGIYNWLNNRKEVVKATEAQMKKEV